jgi:hypothetical protein
MVAFTIRKKDRNATDTCRDNDFFTGNAAAPRRVAVAFSTLLRDDGHETPLRNTISLSKWM